MIDLTRFKDKNFAVLGLGASGLATAEALRAADASVRAWDDDPARRNAAQNAGIVIADFRRADISDIDMLVLSPGIPRSFPAPHPAVENALAIGRPIVSDLDLLGLAMPESAFMGITGSNGKSTTTSLIGHILKRTGVECQTGGNLGPPALALEMLGPDGWYVLEVSSYQLETLASIRWTVGVFLNISPDHLDRYPDMPAYVRAKGRLLERAADNATLIVGVDDDWTRAIARDLALAGRTVWPVSGQGPAKGGVYADNGVLMDALEGAARQIMDLRDIATLPGAHNWQNAAAAYAACRAAGVAATDIAQAMASFPGLRHRQETVAVINGVRFVNDSKATNPDAVAKALTSYKTVYWIAGGRAKPGGLDAIDAALDHVAGAFLIGEAEAMFADHLNGKVPVERCGDLPSAIDAAYDAARRSPRPDPVVLLSPGCASFDQFANFEARGNAFAAAVAKLTNGSPLSLVEGSR
ncbi:MAG: UDP-N-acetylmuramoyl-L-alanine--D-glutamate ligase [Inquilinaceae bacterium]